MERVVGIRNDIDNNKWLTIDTMHKKYFQKSSFSKTFFSTINNNTHGKFFLVQQKSIIPDERQVNFFHLDKHDNTFTWKTFIPKENQPIETLELQATHYGSFEKRSLKFGYLLITENRWSQKDEKDFEKWRCLPVLKKNLSIGIVKALLGKVVRFMKRENKGNCVFPLEKSHWLCNILDRMDEFERTAGKYIYYYSVK